MLYLWVINFAPCYQSLGGIEPFCQWLQCIRDGVRWNVLRRQKIYGWLWRLHGCPNVHPMPWCAPKWTPRQRKRTKCSPGVSSQRYLWISCRFCLCILLCINLATLKYLNLFARHTSQTGPQTKGFTKRAILPASGFWGQNLRLDDPVAVLYFELIASLCSSSAMQHYTYKSCCKIFKRKNLKSQKNEPTVVASEQ